MGVWIGHVAGTTDGSQRVTQPTAALLNATVTPAAGVTWTDGGSGKTLRTIAYNLAATGNVVPAVVGRRIKIFGVKLFASANLTVNWRDGAALAIEGAQTVPANGGYVETVNPPSFVFVTTAGNGLDLVIVGAGNAAGRVSYWDDDTT